MIADYTFVPMGDHCASALILKDIKVRQYSYPFDWIVHVDEYNGSCIPVILSLCEFILETGSIGAALSLFLPIPYHSQITLTTVGPLRNWIRFPHDQFWDSSQKWNDEMQKYKRRFLRLYKHIISGRPIVFVSICRSYLLTQRDIKMINDCLLCYNQKSKFIFISGQSVGDFDLPGARIFMTTVPYRSNTPAYVEYSDKLYYENDIGYWRENVKDKLQHLFAVTL